MSGWTHAQRISKSYRRYKKCCRRVKSPRGDNFDHFRMVCLWPILSFVRAWWNDRVNWTHRIKMIRSSVCNWCRASFNHFSASIPTVCLLITFVSIQKVCFVCRNVWISLLLCPPEMRAHLVCLYIERVLPSPAFVRNKFDAHYPSIFLWTILLKQKKIH